MLDPRAEKEAEDLDSLFGFASVFELNDKHFLQIDGTLHCKELDKVILCLQNLHELYKTGKLS